MFIFFIIIYVFLPLAFVITAYLAYKYHNEFNKLKDSINVSKEMLSKIMEDKKSQDKLDGAVHDVAVFMNRMKEEYEEKIKKFEHELLLNKSILENIKIGYAIITEKTGNFIKCNKEFEIICGFREKQLQEKTLISFLIEFDIKDEMSKDISAILNKEHFTIIDKKNKKIISVTLCYTTVEFKEENLVLMFINDSTEILKIKEELKIHNKKLALIDEITKEVNQSQTVEQILSDTMDNILELTDTEAGIIMLMDKEEKRLKPIAFSGLSMALIEKIKNKPVHINMGTRSRAIETGKTVKSIISETITGSTGTLMEKESLKSIVTVPLKAKDEIIGIMQLASKKEERFSEEDINILDLIGNHLGISINNLNLYETINSQLKQLEKKNIKLTELEQMKTNLIQMIVHDLKNPLMGIMGYIDILLEDENLYSPYQINAIKMIYISSKDLMRMILNLLDISRMEEQRVTLKLDEVNLKDLINKNIFEVKSMIVRENKTIKLELPDKLPIIKADRDLIYRVIANLLNNAIKYSPPGGNITIGIYHGDTGNWLTVYIADEGQGISKDYQNRIFEKFYQIEAKTRNIENFRTSRGLGLTFCKLAVDAHGGRIWVESDVGRGSKFCFNIPFIYFPDENRDG